MIQTEKYLLFLFDNYEPYGGWHDFERASDDVDELLEFAAYSRRDWYQVVSLGTRRVEYEGKPKELLAAHEQALLDEQGE